MCQLGIASCNLSTLGFTVECETMSVVKATESVLLDLQLKVPVSQTEILKSLAAMSSLAEEWKQLPIFQSDSPLKTQLFNMLTPGEKIIASLKVKVLKFFNYIDSSTPNKASTNCNREIYTFDGVAIEEGSKQLVLTRGGITLSGSSADAFANKDLMRKCSDFAINFNTVISSWEEKIDENLANLNLLSEGKFPENFRGILETASCLASVSKDFEEIEVIKCTKQSSIFECLISVTEPTKIVEFIKLCPVIYEDTMLKLGEKMVLAKEMSTNKLKILSCNPNSLSSAMPDCTITDQQQNCLNNLQIDDIDAIILACNFEYGTGPVAYRLRNEGLLIQCTHIL